MEFDEMKKIWDEQSQKALYVFDEEALHNRVIQRKNKAAAVAGRSEQLMMGSLVFCTLVILGASLIKSDFQLFPSLLAVITMVLAGVIYLRRQQRLNHQNTFDKSILGDMNAAIAHADFQVRLSAMGKWIYLVVALLSIASVVDEWAEWYKGALLLLFFVAGYFGARWEHKTFYVSQKQKLEHMREKLISLKDGASV